MIPSSVLVVKTERTLAKEMGEVLWFALQSMTRTHLYKLVLLPGVLAVEKMEPQECTLL